MNFYYDIKDIKDIYFRATEYSLGNAIPLGHSKNDIIIGYDAGTEYQYIIKNLKVYWRVSIKSNIVHEIRKI